MDTPSFAVSTSPWKLQYSTESSDYFSVYLVGNGGLVVVSQRVSAGQTYETFVYGQTGSQLYFSILSAPPGTWTLSVIGDPSVPTPPPGMLFTYLGIGTVNTPPFAANASPWKLQYSTESSDYFSVYLVGNGGLVVVSQRVSVGQTYETFVYGQTGSQLYFSILSAPPGTWTLSVISANEPPDQPNNVSPSDGATNVALTTLLQSSAFSDPDAGDSHTASRWQITTSLGDYSSPVFDSTSSANLTTIAVTSEILDYSTTYYWHVRHQDNHGNWSDWSVETSFTTVANQAPARPINISPQNGATNVSLTPLLQSSVFSDYERDIHTASHWQITASLGDYSSPVYDSGVIAYQLTSISIPWGALNYSTTYYWRVRYQDNYGSWSHWSAETSFTTVANEPPRQPVNISPLSGVTGISVTPTLQSSTFSDPEGDTHVASRWKIRASTGGYDSPVFDSGIDNNNLTRIYLLSGHLSHNTTYYWKVQYQDNYGNWSAWSIETCFTTTTTSPPNMPSNILPANGAIAVSLTPTLQSSAFSDPDTGDYHTASQWQVTTTSGDYSRSVYDSGPSTSSLTSIAVPSGTLSYNTTYYWRVRYRDSHGNWSAYSVETSFMTSTISVDFSASPISGIAPLTVYFTDQSTGDITSWKWDFNYDGIVDSTKQNPSYTYQESGDYTVCLTVGGSWGTHTETKSHYISVYVAGDVEGWAVIIGVSDYKYLEPAPSILPLPWENYDLSYPDDDARGLDEQLSPIWGENHIKLLVDADATEAGIRDAVLNWLAPQEGPEDIVLFFFSGHGNSDYICPYDSLKTSSSNDISHTTLDSWLDCLDSGRIVVILNSCESGGGIGDLAGVGRVILASSAAHESSWGSSELMHSVFPYYLLTGFSEMASVDSNGDQKISAEELFNYVEPKVVSWAEDHSEEQHPQLYDGYVGELDLFSIVRVTPQVTQGIAPVTIDGREYPTAQLSLSFAWGAGTTHTLSVPEFVLDGEGTRYLFTSWSDGNTSTSRTATALEIVTLIANYKTQHYLSVESEHGMPQGEGWYDEGREVMFSVAGGYALHRTFGGWSGDSTADSPLASIVMDGPKTVRATWTLSPSVWILIGVGVALVLTLLATMVLWTGYKRGYNQGQR
jgi:PKD repeat protein